MIRSVHLSDILSFLDHIGSSVYHYVCFIRCTQKHLVLVFVIMVIGVLVGAFNWPCLYSTI